MLSQCFIRSTTIRLNSFGYLPTRLFPTSQLLSAKVCLTRLSQSRGSVQILTFQGAGLHTQTVFLQLDGALRGSSAEPVAIVRSSLLETRKRFKPNNARPR